MMLSHHLQYGVAHIAKPVPSSIGLQMSWTVVSWLQNYAQRSLCTCSCLGSEVASVSAPRSARVRSLTCWAQPYVSSRITTLKTAGFSC